MDLMEFKGTNYPIKVTKRIVDILNGGSMYIRGRDRHNRPIFVLNAEKFQNLSPKPTNEEICAAVTALFEFFRHHMSVNGRIENLLVLIDCENVSYFKANFSQLKALLTLLQ